MAALTYLLLAIASAGFIVTGTVHIAVLCGLITPFQQLARVFVPGLFVVFVPMIFYANRMTRDVKQKDFWKAALRGCPRWMRITLYTIFGYAWLMGLLSFLINKDANSQLSAARGMSGIMLAFYAIAVGVLYSSTQVARIDEDRRCLNGHRVGPLSKFCEECGAPVATNPIESR